MLLCDGGTSYSKIYDTDTQQLTIIPTKELVRNQTRYFDYATGHSSKSATTHYVNELIALAEGGLQLVQQSNFTLLDIGSRDMKFVQFYDRQPVNMDWNSSCGGNIGFTVEVLARHYDIEYDSLEPVKESIPVTCGLLGVEKVFDEINNGLLPEVGIAKFLKGIAKVSFHFAKKPTDIYLSGGFNLNRCFVNILKEFCQVNLLGRDVLTQGLLKIAQKNMVTDLLI